MNYEVGKRYEFELYVMDKKSYGRQGNCCTFKDIEGNLFQWHTYSDGLTVTFLKRRKWNKVTASYDGEWQGKHFIKRCRIVK